MSNDDTFFTRWSRRKVQARVDPPPDDAATRQATAAHDVAAADAVPAEAKTAAPDLAPATAQPAEAAPQPAPLTLADVAELGRESDYSAFVSRGVTPDVKNAALKKLFTDPRYNVMDGLDTYIEDYGKPDPLPAGMLRQMVQSKLLGLFAEEDAAEARAQAASEATPTTPAADTDPAAALPDTTPPDTAPILERATHEDPAVQLQPDHDAGCAGAETGPGPDVGREH
jgi:hypothetical protein